MPTATSTAQHQQASLTTAEKWGETWTSADLEFLAACDEIPLAELAETLGRSYYAVSLARRAIASGHTASLTRRTSRPAMRPMATCPNCFLALPASGACDC